MENASSKVFFRLSHEDNLKAMAQWLFMGVMDPDEIKHELYSTKVMEYGEEMRDLKRGVKPAVKAAVNLTHNGKWKHQRRDI